VQSCAAARGFVSTLENTIQNKSENDARQTMQMNQIIHPLAEQQFVHDPLIGGINPIGELMKRSILH
jgi:hypothetical protein